MPTVPPIPNSDRYLDATATAGQDTFAITWPVIADSELLAVNDLIVEIDDVVIDPSEYSFDGTAVTGLTGIWNGGSVVLDDPLDGGERVVIYSKRDPRRTGSFLEGKRLPFTELDKLLNDFAVQLRDMALRVERAVSISLVDLIDGVSPDGLATEVLDAASTAESARDAAIAAAATAGADLWSRPVLSVLNDPPGAPSVDARYLIGPVPTGAWVNYENQVAQATGVPSEPWLFSGAPKVGQLIGIPSQHDALRFDSTNGWVSVGGEIHIGMFGVPNNTSSFDATAGFQAAVDFCLANSIRRLIAPGNYYFADTVDVSNFSYGFEIKGGGAYAHADFPSNSDWMEPQAIFRYGETGGSMVGQRNIWQYFDGDDKAALWANSENAGCGGSLFHCGFARNFIQVFYEPGGTSPHSSNKLTGHYWTEGAVGVLAKGGAAPAEGLILDVAFISGCKYGAFLGLDGANFVIFGSGFSADFNGHWVSKIAVASLTGLDVGETITCVATSQIARIVSVGTFQGETRIIVAETEDVSGNNSNFANGQTITNGTNSTTITSTPITANHSGNNIYFDVINGMSPGYPFSRWKFNGSYIGGVWSNFLYTDDGSWTNSNSSITNTRQGLMVTNNGAGQMSLYNRFLSDGVPVLDTTATLASFGARDVYMASGGISNANIGLELPNNVTTNIVELPTSGSNGACWLVNGVCPQDANISALAFVAIDNGGAAVLTSIVADDLVLSLSGRTVRGLQNTGAARTIVVNYLRVSLN